MKKSQVKTKLSKDMDTLIKRSLRTSFEEAIEDIKAAIIAQYDEDLVDVVTDRNSKTNPNLYRDEFIERLEEYPYVEVENDKLTLSVPDMDTFDFSGRMRVIQAIMEGMPGYYVEINEDDYKAIFGKRPINEDPVDEYVPPKNRIYLVRYNNIIRKAEKDLKKKFAPYPFSNTPPIRVLDAGIKFVDDNIGKWLDDALKEAQMQFVRNYKGAKL